MAKIYERTNSGFAGIWASGKGDNEAFKEINNIEEFQIYPIPTSDYINIVFDESGKYQMTFINQIGRIIYSEILINRDAKINLTGLPNGTYILRIENEKGIIMAEKIIKK